MTVIPFRETKVRDTVRHEGPFYGYELRDMLRASEREVRRTRAYLGWYIVVLVVIAAIAGAFLANL